MWGGVKSVQSSFNILSPQLKPHYGVRLHVEFGFCGSIVAYITRRKVCTGDV